MLTKGCAAALGAIAAVVVLPSAAYAKDRPKPIVVSSDNFGIVQTVVTSPGHPGHSNRPGGSSSSQVSSCTWLSVTALGADAAASQLSASGIAPGSADGVWYEQYCNGWVPPPIFVPNVGNNRPKPQHTPQTLAVQAVNQLPLPTPAIRHNPSGDALVNLSTWWWVDPAQSAALTQTTRAGAVWATVTAKPVRSTWNAGDGSPVLTCTGGGTPYDTGRSASAQSTSCSHTYTRSSAGQPQSGPGVNDRFFTVTVTVVWQVSYVGSGGASGTLPEMSRTSTFALRVDERQALVTGSSG